MKISTKKYLLIGGAVGLFFGVLLITVMFLKNVNQIPCLQSYPGFPCPSRHGIDEFIANFRNSWYNSPVSQLKFLLFLLVSPTFIGIIIGWLFLQIRRFFSVMLQK